MRYFFIAGSHPLLSIAEISAFFGYPQGLEPIDTLEACILEHNDPIDSGLTIGRLGGAVKVGVIEREIAMMNEYGLISEVLKIPFFSGAKPGSRINFGLSVYGKFTPDLKKIGMTMKNELKGRGVSARFVTGKEKNLSSVIVGTNKLLGEKGAEIVIMRHGAKVFLGRTLAVQPFRELSFRDYGRPSRDDHSGMLPPKLAQIMLNLGAGGRKLGVILDPFCGSGTIITEAMLMGFEKIIGSDISEKAVTDSRANFDWVKENLRPGGQIQADILKADARSLTENIRPGFVDIIVTEPYLGPQRGYKEVGAVKRELEDLYSAVLEGFKGILAKDGRIIMVWPVFTEKGRLTFLDARIAAGFSFFNLLKKISNTDIIIPPLLKKGVTDRGTLIYGREGQRVLREIVALSK